MGRGLRLRGSEEGGLEEIVAARGRRRTGGGGDGKEETVEAWSMEGKVARVVAQTRQSV